MLYDAGFIGAAIVYRVAQSGFFAGLNIAVHLLDFYLSSINNLSEIGIVKETFSLGVVTPFDRTRAHL